MLPRMTKILLAGLALLVSTSLLYGQLKDADPQIQATCNKYLKTPLPAAAARITVPKTWPECNSYKLYSGIGVKTDYSAARQCAWAERLAIQTDLEPRYNVASIFGGAAMLSVLYANGEGVQRNIPLAIRFACEQGWAPAEFEGRVKHLESLQKQPAAASSNFHYCDDITSGAMEGFCASYESELADQKRTGAIRNLSSHWPKAQQAAYDALVQTEQEYAHAHSRSEIDLSGTARAAMEIAAEQQVHDNFLAALQSFEKGKLPQSSAENAVKTDARLNQLYRKELAYAEKHKSEYGAVQPDGIRDAERAWLKYRNAWLAFAKLRYPAVSSPSWLALLTADRILILKDIACEPDFDQLPCNDQQDDQAPRPLP